ncbi:ORF6N domain-containing protein [Pedobacter flavus]|uniref:ORF6N domain-containing protein n=1 Tax=Pedobacter flavus TaxID=3113906 RepID=A0ABU7GYB0_9SPHI|nr:ORF6N domain-containing protein [Pedobacter sp. VNH31]MEE1883999.1 ORF6N domain-containing protein [Pedobacter sp. VNH31]
MEIENNNTTDHTLLSKIYIIRQLKVMLDKDLAMLYGISTKVLNQAVKRNIERFPADFMFRLTAQEYKHLRSQFVTLNAQGKHSKYLPYVFTELGVAMLSSVINSKSAIEMNIRIMRIFTQVRQMLTDYSELKIELLDLKQIMNSIVERQDGQSRNIDLLFQFIDNVQDQNALLKSNDKVLIGFKIGEEKQTLD